MPENPKTPKYEDIGRYDPVKRTIRLLEDILKELKKLNDTIKP